FETLSVESKSIKNLLSSELRRDFGLSSIESDVLSLRSMLWLQDMDCGLLPGQLYLSVPSSATKKYAASRRRVVRLTVVDISRDGETWREYGYYAMQKSRAVGLLYEAWRQGGWFSYCELSSLLNMTPNALRSRLRDFEDSGVWLPHVGNERLGINQDFFPCVVVKEFLDGVSSSELRKRFGFTVSGFELHLRNAALVWDLHKKDITPDEIGRFVGLRPEEVVSLVSLIDSYHHLSSWQELYGFYRYRNQRSGEALAKVGDVGDEGLDLIDILKQEHNMSLITARLYVRRLAELAARLKGEGSGKEGETVFLAIGSEEGPRTRLSEGKVIAVCLEYFHSDDVKKGPCGSHKNRVRDLKFSRILRYATQARKQGALLSLADLAMLMGIGVDSIRRLLRLNKQIVVPTRGLIKDIGRGVSHKCHIVELYLQLYTETEIMERTGHSYESIEAYLKEFARVVALASQGLNAVMIRRVTGRSMALVNCYLEIYRKYDNDADYVFRMEQLKKVFLRRNGLEEAGEIEGEVKVNSDSDSSRSGKKKFPSFRIPTATGEE
ncbi:DUF1670 domain-containing protein, partial [Acidobacteriota bacterium]